ncbi:hypothetical protein LX15_001648 [Streptoalloteichus tenebrarius]|uniref:Uncharacterized protein n=1 Tax=Streptoalloteichus tenebrarius (strain ATCC 17920 / DSM 40477 / JCM 4838 / CBS 697.72 / NBRC 16177 / NCIMB 11028 / NRRL B-12390 / A12253. 1 / ISP 5477) TaxID=1933 RepID=A0ABT1HR13_STRSD|nr:hypothetical protein [Streptoalloteichus tenebrarius]MCP2257961.1 hypothetical protein [Streptoalloteichus tenebrarius]BFF01624.1 hypothetical protein GCM10020241_32990 [Streptoalloteichus tenebrarius]
MASVSAADVIGVMRDVETLKDAAVTARRVLAALEDAAGVVERARGDVAGIAGYDSGAGALAREILEVYGQVKPIADRLAKWAG